ncbi:hypothetical protein FSP39_006906 [Pinctada imbricata]|uniref:Sulfotransferase domain-containing protein n=1 Tax=Pinctada imbricata TaxID=66713 RepID=A0AA89BQ37_PINIB|nr:hypothetical protein FSP39_006906 [Pinctada imbricata]
MEKVDFIDDNGAVLTMKKYEGNYLSPLVWDDFEGQISALDGLGFTKDDVLIVTYLKSVPGDDWVSFHKDWLEFRDGNPDYPFLLLSYEDMKENTEDAVGRIAKFLKEDIDSEMISQIANKCEFQKMLTEKNSNLPPHFEMVTSLKEHVFYRKGKVGDWKNWFTVSQNEEFDTRLGHLADDLNLNIRYTL